MSKNILQDQEVVFWLTEAAFLLDPYNACDLRVSKATMSTLFTLVGWFLLVLLTLHYVIVNHGV